MLYKAHQLQIGLELLESAEAERCYISDGAESLQSEWLGQLLSRRDPNSGELKVSALDLSELHSKTAEAQHAAFKESLKAMVKCAASSFTAASTSRGSSASRSVCAAMRARVLRLATTRMSVQSSCAGCHAMCTVSYTHLRAHETSLHLVCRLLLEKKKDK